MRRILGRLAVLLVLALFPVVAARAQSLNCDSPTRVIPDGRLNGGSIPAGAVFWFAFSTSQPLASYQVEANFPQGAATMPTLGVFAPGDVGAGPTCAVGGSSIMTRDTTALTPEAPNGQRLSFQKTAAGMATFLIRVTNPGLSAESLTLRVAETTLFSSAWSTFGTFDTFYSFVNTTNASIDLTLKLFNTTGAEVATANLTVPANQTLSTNTGTLLVPRSQNGSALLRHNGPTGGLLVEAAIANFAVPPGVIQPVKFQELRAAGPSASGGEVAGGGGGGPGDITSVLAAAGGGLVGGALSGDAVLSLLTSCAANEILKWDGSSWNCSADVITSNEGNVGIGTDPVPNTQLTVQSMGEVTANNAGVMVENMTTNTTADGLLKVGLEVVSAGDFSGGGGTDTTNVGLMVDVSGGDVNAAAVFTGGPVSVGPTGPIDPRILLKLRNTDIVTTADRTVQVDNSATNTTTDGVEKTGVEIMSTGTFTGGGGTPTVNTGLTVMVSGADVNQAATFVGGTVGIGTDTPDPTKSLDIVGDVQIASNLDVDGTITAVNFVGNGSGLTNLPGGGGDITSVNTGPGSGLTGGATSGDVNLSVAFAGPGFASSVARSDHTHALTGGGNTGVGAGALASNSLGSNNTAVGTAALVNSNASSNSAIGSGALQLNTTGVSNTAVGDRALASNTTGGNNTAAGVFALSSNTSGVFNTGVGTSALVSNTTGSGNTAIGNLALASSTTGGDNVAIGRQALFCRNGNTNTAVGTHALGASSCPFSPSDFDGNTAVGSNALRDNLANNNTALGSNALSANGFGTENTAVGSGALQSSSSNNNTALGFFALNSNFGSNNTAVGRGALQSAAGGNNTAVGVNALTSDGLGTTNTALGANALVSNTGSNNIGIGFGAGSLATSGNNNIYIGNTGVAAEGSTIRIGTSGAQTAAFMAGIRGVTTGVADAVAVLIDSNGQLGTISSTRRVKEDIRDMDEASAGLLGLRPVVFRYRQAMADGSKPLRYGLIAEEVAEVMPELVVYDADGQPQTVQYHVLPALLLNELQRQHAEVQTLRAQLEQQKAELAELKAALRATLAQR